MKGKYFLIYIFILITNLSLAKIPQPPFHRGMNLANWFENFSSMSQIHFKLYTKQDFENIKSLGCDHIRLPLELFDMSGPAPDYELDPLLFILLDQIIDWAEDLDLHLILDNHSFDPDSVTNPDIKDQLLAVWRQMADRYKNRSNLIYYEILNEPHGIADAVWHNMQQQAIDTIRAYDQTHTIIVGPANWNNYKNLKYMPAFADTNLIYTFHFYEPHIFTHQGTNWGSPRLGNLGGVPYPYDAARMPDLPEELKGTWIEDRYNAYPGEGNDAWVCS
ncbi:MAG: glycoside hydrolase family 5 protein, partial [bacterium]